jgi:hypothetical protein
MGGKAGSGAGGKGGGSGTSGTGAEGGMGGEGGAAGSVPQCDPTKSPSEDSCVISEDYGVFASPNGSDTKGDGSREKPYATLGKAVSGAVAKHLRVYACADGGTYHESLSLAASASGIELFGGFSCSEWTYSTSAKSRVASSTPLALRVDGASKLHVEGFRFEAADAAMPGESSVGAFITASMNVLLRHTQIEAGKGMAGANGVLESFTYQDRTALNGKNASGTMGGAENVCHCEGTLTTSGGVGGTASVTGQPGSDGSPDHGGGKGGTPGPCSPSGTGQDGAPAPALPPAAGAGKLGTLTSTGWTPAPGTDGSPGSPGQGGGGGASSSTGGGGGGGCGSCGGAGGSGGKGGGASIALIAFESGVTLEEDSVLVASDAGNGGDGATGQVAQMQAGFGGTGTVATGSCNGGVGGLGADGQFGGGAAGGISVGILWQGDMAPTQTGVTITTGIAGAKGIGGSVGVNDGIDGVAQDALKAP